MTAIASEVTTSAKARAVAAEAPWTLGFRSLETEIARPRALPVRGTMPRELSGVLYRIGPARHDVYGERLASWFDGDGMVHALAIDDGRVTYKNRFVATPGKLAEDEAKKRLYGGLPVAVARWRDRPLSAPERLEEPSQHEHRLPRRQAARALRRGPAVQARSGDARDPGRGRMSGTLAAGAHYSAHPKLDRATGEMWNFGTPSDKTTRSPFTGPRRRADDTGRDGPAARARDGARLRPHPHEGVFVIPPNRAPANPRRAPARATQLRRVAPLQPELGVNIAVVNSATGETRWIRTDPFMMFHTSTPGTKGATWYWTFARTPTRGSCARSRT